MSSNSEDSSETSSPSRQLTPVLSDPHNDDSDDEHDHSESEAQDATPEVPVLSHADKRRQKKKELTRQTEADTTHVVPQPADGSTNSSASKRRNSVWVGNLAFKTTPDALRKFFDGVGEITRIHMPLKASSTRNATAQDNNKRLLKENRGSDFPSHSLRCSYR